MERLSGATTTRTCSAATTSIWGAAAAVRYGGSSTDVTTGKGQWCANYIASNKLTAANTSADFSCNPDYNVVFAGIVTRWTPVKNLTFSAELGYFHLDQKFSGTAHSDAFRSEADHGLRVQGSGHGLSLQLLLLRASESMSNHDSEIVDAGSVD